MGLLLVLETIIAALCKLLPLYRLNCLYLWTLFDGMLVVSTSSHIAQQLEHHWRYQHVIAQIHI